MAYKVFCDQAGRREEPVLQESSHRADVTTPLHAYRRKPRPLACLDWIDR
jgi:hypothetical protein